MRRYLSPIVSLCCLMLVCTAVRADQVENPAYKAWAGMKPGTSVTMNATTNANGQTVKMETKTTLNAVDADKVTLDIANTMDMSGQKMTMPATKIELKKMVDSTPTQGPAQVTPDQIAKATEEDVTVPAGTFKAKVIEMNMSQQGANFKGKTWYSDQVPGGTVKMQMTSDGAVKSDTTIELTTIDKK